MNGDQYIIRMDDNDNDNKDKLDDISMGNPENVAKIVANWYRKMRMFTGRMNMKDFILDPNIMNLIIDCVVFKEIHSFQPLTKFAKSVYQFEVDKVYDSEDIKNSSNLYCFASRIF